jgi:hypothetical protein
MRRIVKVLKLDVRKVFKKYVQIACLLECGHIVPGNGESREGQKRRCGKCDVGSKKKPADEGGF